MGPTDRVYRRTAKVAVGKSHQSVQNEGPVVVREHLVLLREDEGSEEDESSH